MRICISPLLVGTGFATFNPIRRVDSSQNVDKTVSTTKLSPPAFNYLSNPEMTVWLRNLCKLSDSYHNDVLCNQIEKLKPNVESIHVSEVRGPVISPVRLRRVSSPETNPVVPPRTSPVDPHTLTPLGVISQGELKTEIFSRVFDRITPSHGEHSKPSIAKWTSLTEELVPKVLLDLRYAGHDLSPVHLGRPPIYRKDRTGVFSIDELPGKVIKYYMYCKSDEDIFDAIVLESFFMEKLADEGICPHVYYYSDYMTSGGDVNPFIPVNGGKTEAVECDWETPDNPPNIRYMIMEQVGTAIDTWAEKTYDRPTFINVMRVGAQMIVLLKKLHDWNILHGDAHWGNFAFKAGKTGDLVMLDFGRSRIINEKVDYAAYGGKAPSDKDGFCRMRDWLHVYTGKWEMQKCNPAFRDDVYRAVQNCAMAIYDFRLRVHLEEIADESSPYLARYREIKNKAHFFELPPDLAGRNKFTIKGLVPDDKLELIRAELREISKETARDNPDPLTKPAYGKIIESYRNIILSLNPSLRGKSDSEIFRVV